MRGVRAVQVSKADGLDTEVYLLDCEGGLVLVDVGFTSQCQINIENELDEMGKNWSDINKIIITHAHGDHIDNLPKIKTLTDAEVIIGRGDEESLLQQTGVKADVILDQEDVIGECGNIEIIHIPGHSKGNIALYLSKYKAIIAGDTIFEDSEGNLEAPPKKYCDDVAMATKNLKILERYDFDKILLSHGKNIMNNAKQKVDSLIKSCS
jgi:glyoxylase-like metal-dependent hydrolase (beta-lactamase superfamily II)